MLTCSAANCERRIQAFFLRVLSPELLEESELNRRLDGQHRVTLEAIVTVLVKKQNKLAEKEAKMCKLCRCTHTLKTPSRFSLSAKTCMPLCIAMR